jgi:hypothetical protein
MSDSDTMMKEERDFFPLVIFVRMGGYLRPYIKRMYLDERHKWKPSDAKLVADFVNYESIR